ncbi:MAG: DUF3048 domain-containing protein [Bacillus sp. (in: firmicutes)]
MKMKHTLSLLICIGFASLLMVGCSNDEEALEDAISNSKDVYPLTGLEVKDEENERAVAVMINNHPDARPQSGLQKADVVYEMLAEGNVTRFLAVYQSEHPERVGPVRSARDYYIEIAKGLNSLYVCHGYSPEAKELLEDNYVDSLNGLFYDGTLFKRDSSRKAPHNSYISFSNIEKGAEEKGYDMTIMPPSFSFLSEDEREDLAGEDTSLITIEYGSDLFDVTYEYDEAEEVYTRTVDGEQTLDQDTGEQVAINNVIVIEAPHEVIDNEGRRDIDFSEGGSAYLLQKGKWNRIQWQFVDKVFIFMKDGMEIEFVPGKTWINIIPTNPGLQDSVTIH